MCCLKWAIKLIRKMGTRLLGHIFSKFLSSLFGFAAIVSQRRDDTQHSRPISHKHTQKTMNETLKMIANRFRVLSIPCHPTDCNTCPCPLSGTRAECRLHHVAAGILVLPSRQSPLLFFGFSGNRRTYGKYLRL